MNETKNQRLAKEITAFCIDRVKSGSVKKKSIPSILSTALASFFGIAFTVGGSGTSKGTFWTQ